MKYYNTFVKNITYPLWMFKDRRLNLYKYLWEYRKYNLLSYEEIRKRQKKKLEAILKHAYQHTEYYKTLFDENGISFADLTDSYEAISKLPILSKLDIADNTEKMFADNFSRDKLLQDSTGGSTGIPLVFYRDWDCMQKRRAQELFFDKWIGYEPGDKVAFFVAARHHPGGVKSIKRKFRNATCDRVLAFDPSKTDKGYMEKFLNEIRKFKPEVIKCFPNSLFIFAKFLKEKGVYDIKPRAVSCTGETLHDYQKELFKEVFQCPVFEKYGSFEVGVAACECSEHNGMHIFPDGVYFEFVNSDGEYAKPGELAQLIVTDLFNYGFPLIRYKIGDVGVFSKETCPCGSPLPMISKLFGRDRDILIDQDNNLRPGYLFVEIFNKNHIPGQFQVIQKENKDVLIKISKNPKFNDSHELLIMKKMKELLGDNTHIEIDYVHEILREASGKYRYVQSMISPFKY